jgi:RHS repeat-associated protein
VRYRFTGKELDATGLQYFGTRYYDPVVGRFISVDRKYAQQPIKSVENPQGLNTYAYSLNNPVRYVDPKGESWIDKVQTGLDVFGLVPGIGEVADLTNAAIYAARGQYGNAALSATGAIPFAGWFATGSKLAGKAVDLAKPTKNILGDTARVANDNAKSPLGEKVYRVYSGDSQPFGQYWSPVDPRTVPNYRDAAGLPSKPGEAMNTGRFVIEGRITNPTGIKLGPASPLHGNRGGLPEYKIPDAASQVHVERVSGVNPEF